MASDQRVKLKKQNKNDNKVRNYISINDFYELIQITKTNIN